MGDRRRMVDVELDAAQIDRAAGALVGLACGDALGAGYEFAGTVPDEPQMIGGGLGRWEPGEWTDDTQMAICIAEVTATGDVDAEAIAGRFLDWYRSEPADVGIQTSSVLGGVDDPADLATKSAAYFERHPNGAAGNGSLMRTAPVALAHLGDDEAIAEAAMEMSLLTHGDPLAGEACVVWCIAIDRAVRESRLDGVADGIDLLPADRRDDWSSWLAETYDRQPASFGKNGFVVSAFQAAHSAVTTAVPEDGPRCLHFQEALKAAVRAGHDTDTVGAIAGQLLGARWGLSAVPFRWRRQLHGWPGYTVRDLARLAVLTVRGGEPDSAGWPDGASLLPHYRSTNPAPPAAVPLPGDEGVLAGNVHALPQVDVDAVVSLCRVGPGDVPDDVEHHEVFLIDKARANPNLDFVLADTVDAIATLRDEGKTVFVHCAGGTSRTPTVAALYVAERSGIAPAEALEQVTQVLEHKTHNADFVARFGGDSRGR